MVAVCPLKEMNNYPVAKSQFNHSGGIGEPRAQVK